MRSLLAASLLALSLTLASSEARAQPSSDAGPCASEPNAFALALNEAGMATLRGDPARAIAAYEDLLRREERCVGEGSPMIPTLLDLLGATLQTQGAFDRAGQVYERLTRAIEARSGPQSPALVQPLIQLTMLRVQTGESDRAEAAIRHAMRVETEHARRPTALTRGYLAYVLEARGRYADAVAVHRETLRELEANPRTPLAERIGARIALARTLDLAGDRTEASAMLERVTREVSTALARQDRTAAAGVGLTLALLQTHRGELAQAARVMRDARANIERVATDDPTIDAGRAQVTAMIEAAQGRYDVAIDGLRSVLATVRQRFGPDHTSTHTATMLLATVLLATSRGGEALSAGLDSLSSTERRLALMTGATPAQVTGVLRTEAYLDDFARSAAIARPDDADARTLALTATLLHKGRGVDVAADLSRAVLHALGPEDRARYEALRALRGRLAGLVTAGPRAQPLDAWRRTVDALRAESEALESDLARRSVALRARRATPAPSNIVSEVSSALAPDTALIEYVAFTPFEVRTPGVWRQPPAHYAAFVVTRDSHHIVDLGPASAIDAAAAAMLRGLRQRDVRYENGGTAWVAPARALDALIMAPLRPLVGARTRLFIAPDGQLDLVPFAALHDGRDALLGRVAFAYLTSGRDLLRPTHEGATGVDVFADPDLGAFPAPAPVDAMTTTRAATFALASLPALPGTRVEAQAISARFPSATVLVGADATEAALLEVRAPALLHVGTHGVFVDDAPAPVATPIATPGANQAPALSSDPLLRSALVLAGARAYAASPDPRGSSDGLATALEVAGMDLWGTQLVVLSACDSGVGEARRGDGVHGLRRAVLVAGAETLVTSLWTISDTATRDLMTAFYDALRRGERRAAALDSAAMAVRARRPHPSFWAPFIAIGRDAPIALSPTVDPRR